MSANYENFSYWSVQQVVECCLCDRHLLGARDIAKSKTVLALKNCSFEGHLGG